MKCFACIKFKMSIYFILHNIFLFILHTYPPTKHQQQVLQSLLSVYLYIFQILSTPLAIMTCHGICFVSFHSALNVAHPQVHTWEHFRERKCSLCSLNEMIGGKTLPLMWYLFILSVILSGNRLSTSSTHFVNFSDFAPKASNQCPELPQEHAERKVAEYIHRCCVRCVILQRLLPQSNWLWLNHAWGDSFHHLTLGAQSADALFSITRPSWVTESN